MKQDSRVLNVRGYDEAGRSSGFTLIEILVTLALVSLFMAAAMTIVMPLSRSYTRTDVASGAQQVVRMAVEIIANDIRLAGLDPLKSAGAGLQEAGATSIRFTCDRVADGETEANGEIDNANFESINYYYVPATESLNLRLYAGAPVQTSQELVNNVSDMRFRYFDQNGAETGDLAEIRAVQISMTVEEDVGVEGTLERSYTTRVLCRNLGP